MAKKAQTKGSAKHRPPAGRRKETGAPRAAGGKAKPPDEKDPRRGYRGAALEFLKKSGVKVGTAVVLTTPRGRFEGRVLPRPEGAADPYVTLKTPSGYVIGVDARAVAEVKETQYPVAPLKTGGKKYPTAKGKPNVKLLEAGGNLAGRIDYVTGALVPAHAPGEYYENIPEIADLCNLETEHLFDILPENLGAAEYVTLAKAVAREIEAGADGVIVAHGADTLHHTAAVLAFMVQNPPVPVVLTGALRSSDRPTSDAARNFVCAARAAAESDIAEISVCMPGTTSDLYSILHRGTRVRKMHATARTAFRTIGDVPLAKVDGEHVTPLREDYARRRPGDRSCLLQATFEPRVALVHYYPNMDRDLIDALVDRGYRGIVIAGTGFGVINKPCHPALARAQEAGVAVYMTVQTFWGYAELDGHEGGRDVRRHGVVALANMLPEVAYLKLCWALGQTRDAGEAKRLMLTPFAGEITDREPPDGYLILQAGLPETEAFLSSHWK